MAEGMPKGQYQFQEGHAKIEGSGRPLGSRSGNTMLRDMLRGASVDLFPVFIDELMRLRHDDPKAFCDLYLKMTERVVPKVSAVQFEVDGKSSSAMDHLRLTAAWEEK